MTGLTQLAAFPTEDGYLIPQFSHKEHTDLTPPHLFLVTPMGRVVWNRETLNVQKNQVSNAIEQGVGKLYCKGPDSKYFSVLGPRGKIHNIM